MPMIRKKRNALTETVLARFPTGEELQVEYRRTSSSYGRVKVLTDLAREGRRQTLRAESIKRKLENKSVDNREELEQELTDIELNSVEMVDQLVDWMVGADSSPGAIIDWDYFEDEEMREKVPITRERFAEFQAPEILAVSSAILEALNVGESKGGGSPAPSPRTA